MATPEILWLDKSGESHGLIHVLAAPHTERHLLYVACTRARDNLLVTGVEPASEFIDDLTE